MVAYVELYFIKDKTIKKVPINSAVETLYYIENNVRIPTQQELINNKSKTNVSDIKQELSLSNNVIPLYDVYTTNIYLIQRRNVYIRVVHDNYRFPDKLILNEIIKLRTNRLKQIKLYPELKKDNVFMRKINKINLMLTFMNSFHNKTLFNTYVKIFYRYAPELANGTYTCLRKSFIPHKNHLKPYYSRDEIIKLAMNMEIIKIPKNTNYHDFKDNISVEKYHDICIIVQKNDISATNLVEHQNYIIKNSMTGLIQYYSIQGSYFMNQYMRGLTKYVYQNSYLETSIRNIWDAVINAPAFDNDYILYRFVKSDTYLNHLNIGDIYIEKGFTSTTRDPFYRHESYEFGFILIKIRIPKNVIGVGLCLETISHFPAEEEIILAPMCHLQLISKNNNCKYYHPDESFVANVKSRYEFKWIKNGDTSFPKREKFKDDTKIIDFLKLKRNNSSSLNNKIEHFFHQYCDPMNRIKCNIGDNIFYVVAEFFDSSDVYKDMYALKISKGFSLYSIYNGYILFMIEIGEENGIEQIHINYFTKYSQLKRDDVLGVDNFIKFIASVAYYFNISTVVLYADHISCDHEQYISKKSLSRQIIKYNKIIEPIVHNSNKQLTFNDKKKIISHDSNKIKTDVFDKIYTGGSYCIDHYMYLKYNIKKYNNIHSNNIEIQPRFSYDDIDMLKYTSPDIILKKNDRDEIYQIYNKNYKLDNKKEKHNIADFYIWMIKHKCFLIDIFVGKLDRVYRHDNPFKKDYYMFDIFSYLYNKGIVPTYNRYIKMNIDIDHAITVLPKNRYTTRR
jgi:hypothetical protein